jgi:imidazolonepropionase-like amidohydrolase
MAWSYGLPHDEAVRAITLYPARILGMGDRLGSLEVGKEATLIVADGDILEIRSHVVREYIAGRLVDLSNKHTRLYEEYLERDRVKPGR